MGTKDIILKQLADNPVIIYMKGVPTAPECGFSRKAVEILNATKIPYAYVDVLKAPFIRDRLPSISKWPTFPQLFVKGELIGGCDIVETLYKDGSLLSLLEKAIKPATENAMVNTLAPSEVEALISEAYPGAVIYIEGEGCSFTITIIADQFTNLTLIKQHQGVMAALSQLLASGRLHAVTLKTFTPEQWQAQQPVNPAGLLQIQF